MGKKNKKTLTGAPPAGTAKSPSRLQQVKDAAKKALGIGGNKKTAQEAILDNEEGLGASRRVIGGTIEDPIFNTADPLPPPPLIVPPTLTNTAATSQPKSGGYGEVLPPLERKEMEALYSAVREKAKKIIERLDQEYSQQKKLNAGENDTPNMRRMTELQESLRLALINAETEKDANLNEATSRLIFIVTNEKTHPAAKLYQTQFREIELLRDTAKRNYRPGATNALPTAATSSQSSRKVYKTLTLAPARDIISFQSNYEEFSKDITFTTNLLAEVERINAVKATVDNLLAENQLRELLADSTTKLAKAKEIIDGKKLFTSELSKEFHDGTISHYLAMQAILENNSTLFEQPSLKQIIDSRNKTTTPTNTSATNASSGTAGIYQSATSAQAAARAANIYAVPNTTLQGLIDGATIYYDKLNALGSTTAEIQKIRSDLSEFIKQARLSLIRTLNNPNEAEQESIKYGNKLDTITKSFESLTGKSLAAPFSKAEIEAAANATVAKNTSPTGSASATTSSPPGYVGASTNASSSSSASSSTTNPSKVDPAVAEKVTALNEKMAATDAIIKKLENNLTAKKIHDDLVNLNTLTKEAMTSSTPTVIVIDLQLQTYNIAFEKIRTEFTNTFPGKDINAFTTNEINPGIENKQALLAQKVKIEQTLKTLETLPDSAKRTQYTRALNNALTVITQINNNENVAPSDITKTLEATKRTLKSFDDNLAELKIPVPRTRAASLSTPSKQQTLINAKNELIDTLNQLLDKAKEDGTIIRINSLEQNALAIVAKLKNENVDIYTELNSLKKEKDLATGLPELKNKLENFENAANAEIAKINKSHEGETVSRHQKITLPALIVKLNEKLQEQIQVNPTHKVVAILQTFIQQAQATINDAAANLTNITKLIHNIQIQLEIKPSTPAPDGKAIAAAQKLIDRITAETNTKKANAKKDAEDQLAKKKIEITNKYTKLITEAETEKTEKIKSETAAIQQDAKTKKEAIELNAKALPSTIDFKEHINAALNRDIEISKIDRDAAIKIAHATIDASAAADKKNASHNANMKSELAQEAASTSLLIGISEARINATDTIEKSKVSLDTKNDANKLKEIAEKANVDCNNKIKEFTAQSKAKSVTATAEATKSISDSEKTIDIAVIAKKESAQQIEEKNHQDRITTFKNNTDLAIAAYDSADFEQAEKNITATAENQKAIALKTADDAIKAKNAQLEKIANEAIAKIDADTKPIIAKTTTDLTSKATTDIDAAKKTLEDAAKKAKDNIDAKAVADKAKADLNPTTADYEKAKITAIADSDKKIIDKGLETDIAKKTFELTTKKDLEIKLAEINAQSEAEIKKNEIVAKLDLDKATFKINTDHTAGSSIADIIANATITKTNANPALSVTDKNAAIAAANATLASEIERLKTVEINDSAKAQQHKEDFINLNNRSAQANRDTKLKTETDKANSNIAQNNKDLDDSLLKAKNDINAETKAAIAKIDASNVKAVTASAITQHTKALDKSEAALEKASKALGLEFEKISNFPFSGKKDLEDKAVHFSMLVRDLRKSPNLQQRLDTIADLAKNNLHEGDHKLLDKEKNPDLNKAFDAFMQASRDHINNIKDQKDKYHAVFNVEQNQSTIIDLDSKKSDLDNYNDNKAKVGITSAPVTGAPVADLTSGSNRNNPSVAEKISSTQMRICAMKTKDDEHVGYVETFKMNTARSSIYEMPPGLASVQTLLKENIIDQRAALNIPATVTDQQLNDVFKRMLPLITSKTLASESKLKDVIKAGLIQLGVDLPKEQYKQITSAIVSTYTASSQQTFNGVLLPSDDLIRLAISQVNGIKQTKPDQPININKAPSPDYVRAIMFVAMANGKENEYKVINNKPFTSVIAPTKAEIEAYKLLVHKNRLNVNKDRFGAETKRAPDEHIEYLDSMTRRR